MAEFLIDFAVWFFTTCGHIEIVQGEGGLAVEPHTDMAAIALLAKIARMLCCKGKARNDGDTVITLLAKFSDMLVAQLMQGAGGKLPLRAFGFLKAEDIRRVFFQHPFNKANAQADRIDVPSGETKTHDIVLA